MQTVGLGDTGVRTSAMSLGCMYVGTRIDRELSFKLLDRYVGTGGTFLDTANCYAFWIEGASGDESEELLGQWMKLRGARDDVFVATKVGARPAFSGGRWPEDAQGLSAAVIIEDVERSLRRLQTDRIDLYYAHLDDRKTPLEETLEAFARLVRAGKIRHVGCSNTATWRIERARQISRANGWPAYCCVQQKYTYLRPAPGRDFGPQQFVSQELLDYCAADDVTILGYSPLLLGAYTRADRSMPDEFRGPDTDARLAALRAISSEIGATPNQVVLAWMMQSAPAIIPVVAAGTEEQLEEDLAALDVRLSPDQLQRLQRAGA